MWIFIGSILLALVLTLLTPSYPDKGNDELPPNAIKDKDGRLIVRPDWIG